MGPTLALRKRKKAWLGVLGRGGRAFFAARGFKAARRAAPADFGTRFGILGRGFWADLRAGLEEGRRLADASVLRAEDRRTGRLRLAGQRAGLGFDHRQRIAGPLSPVIARAIIAGPTFVLATFVLATLVLAAFALAIFTGSFVPRAFIPGTVFAWTIIPGAIISGPVIPVAITAIVARTVVTVEVAVARAIVARGPILI